MYSSGWRALSKWLRTYQDLKTYIDRSNKSNAKSGKFKQCSHNMLDCTETTTVFFVHVLQAKMMSSMRMDRELTFQLFLTDNVGRWFFSLVPSEVQPQLDYRNGAPDWNFVVDQLAEIVFSFVDTWFGVGFCATNLFGPKYRTIWLDPTLSRSNLGSLDPTTERRDWIIGPKCC